MSCSNRNNNDLRGFFWPKGIAVIGASADPYKPGNRVIHLLKAFNYTGGIYPVNPGRREILGLPCYSTLKDVSEPFDLVVISLPAAQVSEIVAECASLGLKNMVIFSGGFAEVAGEGSILQGRLAALAREHNLNILGPNCIGFINTLQPAAATFSLTVDSGKLRSGPAAFIAQSGGLGVLLLFMADREKLGLSYVISTGNEVGIDFTDAIEFLAGDPSVSVIGGYLEGVRDGERLRRSCRAAAGAGKPVVLMKAGASAEAAEAIRSHTGALAGRDDAYRAFFREEGVITTETTSEMLALLKVFTPGRLPAGNRVALYSLSGGMGVLAADLCAGSGLTLAEFSPATTEKLHQLMPAIATVRNPLDPTAALASSIDSIYRSLEIIFDDPNVDMLIFITAIWRVFGSDAARMLEKLFRHNRKPLLVIWPGSSDEVRDLICESGIPMYDELREGVGAAAALWRYADFRQQHGQPRPVPAEIPAGAPDRVKAVLQKHPDKQLNEEAAKKILAAYGIEIPRGEVAATLSEAEEAAVRIGYPVVLKVLSPEILHKTEAGGIRVGLDDPSSLRRAWEQVQRDLSEKAPGITPEGFLVEEMLPVRLELVAGARNDEIFGPLLLAGLGGVFVELFQDVATRLAPVAPSEALAMFEELKGSVLLKGFRGTSAIDPSPAAEAISRFSRLAVDLRGEYRELEINPLVMCGDGRVVAADALILR